MRFLPRREVTTYLAMALLAQTVWIIPFTLGVGYLIAVTQQSSGDTETIYIREGHRWFEDAWPSLTISSGAQWALFAPFGQAPQLVSLPRGMEVEESLLSGLDDVRATTFCGEELLRQGRRGGEDGWFRRGVKGLERVALPQDAVPFCSRDAKWSAYFRAGAVDGGLFIGNWIEYKQIAIQGVVTGAAFSPDAQAVYALARQSNGAASLAHADSQTGRTEVLARELDAAPFTNRISVSSDGKRLYLSLASENAPDDTARQKPEAKRWLNIYEFDLATRRLKRLTQSNVDQFGAVAAGGFLYWAQNVMRDSIVVLPAAGGAPREVIADAEIPSWSRDGRRLSFSFGQWRLVDWALNLDAGVVTVDSDAKRTSERSVIVAGNHEDFPPEWSPDGKWIAFHSHRAPKAVPAYNSPGASDDIWLRRPQDVAGPEIRLTDFGWETGSPSWSPDGKRLVFSSWDRAGKPGVYRLWIITIDPATGRALKIDKLPLHGDIHSPEWAVWSPVSETIALEDESGASQRAIWVVASDGSNPRRIVTYKSDTYGGLDWSPNGKLIVYSALGEGRMEIFAIPLAGGQPKRLSSDSANLMHPRVSPDGRWIACTRLETHQEIRRKKE